MCHFKLELWAWNQLTAGCNTFLFLSTPTILPNSLSLFFPYHLSIRVPPVILPSLIRQQCRLLQSAICNFLGQKVTCPAISNIARAECLDDPRPVIEQALLTCTCAHSKLKCERRPRLLTSWLKRSFDQRWNMVVRQQSVMPQVRARSQSVAK